MTMPDSDNMSAIVSRVFRVEEVTLGDPKQSYFMRYRGELLVDSIEAYDQLAKALRPYDVTPLFRIEDGRQTVLLVRGVVRLGPAKTSTNILMFALTVLSVMFTGAVYSYTGPLPPDMWGQLLTWLTHLWVGWPFAVSMLGILLAHEFGHYFAGRARGAAVTLPYFIPLPFPLSPFGTMGAFIQMKEPPRNRRALFDLAIAGPLAGLAVAVPVLFYGLSLSHLDTVPAVQGGWAEGNSLLYLLAKFAIFGKWLPVPPDLTGPPLLMHWLSYFFIGRPSPVGSLDVLIGPVAFAAWAGLLVTFLNLIPAGQLDGGHVLFTVFGKHVKRAWVVILAVTLLLGVFWGGWWLWSALIFLFGRTHAEPLDQITPLGTPRRLISILMLVVFLLVLTPVPLILF
jgi:Zn-dependent protease